MPISRRHFTAGALASMAGGLPDRLLGVRPRPRLFVFVIAEQFRQVYLDRTGNRLTPSGFRELMGKGVYCPDCRLASSGFTSSALATMATGSYPQLHGIVADQWLDRRSHVLTKARAELLEATTLADEAAGAGHSRIYCLGLSEGPTSLLAGRSKGQVFWMDDKGKFQTRGNIPEWLGPFNNEISIEGFRDKNWMALGAGLGMPPLRRLTYDPKRPEEFYTLYQSSPYCQTAQFDLLQALHTAEKLGQGDTLDFVFLNLGSMAQLGYETGSDSVLMDQMTLHLDRQIQRTLELLNKTPGKAGYNLIFAGAHGAPPEPDAAMRSDKVIAGEGIARNINRGLSDYIDKAGVKTIFVDKYVYPFLYLKLDAIRKSGTQLRFARKLAGEVALRTPGVAGYYTADGDCSHTGDWRQRFENSFNELRSGDVMLAYQPGAVEDFAGGRGVSYGSLYNYDTRVPVFFYGAQFGKKVIERTIDMVDLAPTIARAASIGLPSSAIGDVLAEAYAESAEDERPK